MFTGIVTEIGKVVGAEPTAEGTRLTIHAPSTADDLSIGDSVAIDGACLTVTGCGAGSFRVEAVAETLARTALGALQEGSMVNLERAMAASSRFDGHLVQGHVDGTVQVSAMAEEGGSLRMRLAANADLLRYIVEKGSVTLDGVSLTIAAVDGSSFEVVLIPHTIEVTGLGRRQVGDQVNVELDLIAKYVEKMLGDRS